MKKGHAAAIGLATVGLVGWGAMALLGDSGQVQAQGTSASGLSVSAALSVEAPGEGLETALPSRAGVNPAPLSRVDARAGESTDPRDAGSRRDRLQASAGQASAGQASAGQRAQRGSRPADSRSAQRPRPTAKQQLARTQQRADRLLSSLERQHKVQQRVTQLRHVYGFASDDPVVADLELLLSREPTPLSPLAKQATVDDLDELLDPIR